MPPFRFQQFTVHHDRSTMKVGTDGVLLPALAQLYGARRVLDAGCGCGVVALIAAQRSAAHIVALDIDAASVEEARTNFQNSPFASRLEAVQGDVREYAAAVPFDVILSNPPYHAETLLPPDARRSAARHTAALSFAALCTASAQLLRPGGSLQVIVPAAALTAFHTAAALAGFSLTQRIDIVTRQGRPPRRVVLTFTLTPPQGAPQHDTLTMHGLGGAPTPEYEALMRPFLIRV